MQFIETDGRVYGGAEAVFRSLAYGPCGGVFSWLYRRVPGFAPVAEWVYQFVARRRTAFSFLTRLFWGREGALPGYRLTGWVFLRLLGVIYLCAFASLGTQIIGLGRQKRDFAGGTIDGIGAQGSRAARYWLGTISSVADTLLVSAQAMDFCGCCVSPGCALSIFLIVNIAPAPCLFLLWLIYLSLASVCRVVSFVSMGRVVAGDGVSGDFFCAAPILSGLVEITRAFAGRVVAAAMAVVPADVRIGRGKTHQRGPTWRNLTALNFHYETQPLPTWVGWYAHQLPEGFQRFCVVAMFTIELVVPFLIFLPRRLRFTGCWLLILLQVVILLTGNYCFFNLLTIALCLLLLDDAPSENLFRQDGGASPSRKIVHCNRRSPPKKLWKTLPCLPRRRFSRRRGWRWPVWVTLPLALVILLVTVPQVWEMVHGVRARSAGLEVVD